MLFSTNRDGLRGGRGENLYKRLVKIAGRIRFLFAPIQIPLWLIEMTFSFEVNLSHHTLYIVVFKTYKARLLLVPLHY